MKNFIISILAAIVIITLMSGCSKNRSNVNNVINNDLDVYEIIIPEKMNDLTYEIEVIGSLGFFDSNEEFYIRFYEYQSFYEIYDHEKFFIATGHYVYNSFSNFVVLTIQDSRFGEGTMQFEFNDKKSGKFKLFAGEYGTDIQFGRFKLKEDK